MPTLGVHPLFIVAVLVVVLIIFGPGKLPDFGAGMGKAISEFRRAMSDAGKEISNAASAPEAPVAPPAASAPAAAPEVPHDQTP
ncbi:MAG TPA: twin-arginine translocase TatA/TatE family subunit [Candidatus Dormibacteraeota bacterium]|jgi:sec-independent protein translocase protein TatA|nr:twin-arginine translocase TatA/TatE family subunit [Candidatus Dormibacteraeota bacterium]